MRSRALVVLVGNVGRDSELAYTTAGKAIAKFSVATANGYKETSGTSWHNVVLFDKLAESISSYVRKGIRVYVEGRIETRSYEKNGEKRFATDIIANEVILLDGKAEGAPATAQPARRERPAPPVDEGLTETLDDSDVPF